MKEKTSQNSDEKKSTASASSQEARVAETTGSETEGQTGSVAAEKQSEKREEQPGIAYINTSQNNTMIHITDLAGNTISRVTGGMVTKHSRLKADPTIAMFIAKKAAERARDLGITALYVRTRAKTGSTSVGSGAHAAIKSLDKEGFKIISILDTTQIPRGGPKKKGGKRGRRV
jgi:small subunit ribosomal protein S11